MNLTVSAGLHRANERAAADHQVPAGGAGEVRQVFPRPGGPLRA